MTSLDLAPARSPVGASTKRWQRPRLAGVLYAALTAVMAAPALLWPIPRGTDLVNHWARLTLYGMAPDDPLRGLYKVSFGLIPNLGIDALYLALSPLLSAQSVARLALALSIVLPAWGAWRLHRALFAKPSPTIWFAPFVELQRRHQRRAGQLWARHGAGACLALAFVAERGERLTLGDYVAAESDRRGAVLLPSHRARGVRRLVRLRLMRLGAIHRRQAARRMVASAMAGAARRRAGARGPAGARRVARDAALHLFAQRIEAADCSRRC